MMHLMLRTAHQRLSIFLNFCHKREGKALQSRLQHTSQLFYHVNNVICKRYVPTCICAVMSISSNDGMVSS